MHRVELKAKQIHQAGTTQTRFLMHRVELKVFFSFFLACKLYIKFLMHRVELKEIWQP